MILPKGNLIECLRRSVRLGLSVGQCLLRVPASLLHDTMRVSQVVGWRPGMLVGLL